MSQYTQNSTSMIELDSIYAAIRDNGFSEQTIQLIDNYTNDNTNFKIKEYEKTFIFYGSIPLLHLWNARTEWQLRRKLNMGVV